MKVTVYTIKFNHDDRCYEVGIYPNLDVKDFNEYNNIITLDSPAVDIKQFKLDSVEIFENDGYYITASSLSSKECLTLILNAMTKRSSSIISAETDRLELLSQVSVVV